LNKKTLRADGLLLLAAFIWGLAFVAQRVGMDYMGPFTYNGIRYLLGLLTILPLIIFRHGKAKKLNPDYAKEFSWKKLIKCSLALGTVLTVAVSMQQIAIMYTTAGNTGFLTSLYVAFTPIAGIFLGRKTGIPTWIGACLSVAGTFCLSIAPSVFSGGAIAINPGDIITFISAFVWTAHVLMIDSFVHKVDPIQLSAGQFIICGVVSLIIGLIRETITLEALIAGAIPLLYGGIGSVGIAYTLQVVGQKDSPPAHATILLSMEGVFSAVGGTLILHETLSSYTLGGFILIFIGIMATQWDVIRGKH
jgi:drug/metabolite transporter (DMT)-like permease